MARKPLDQLSPAYRRRIERAEARGISRQEARGHKNERVNSAIRRHARKVANFTEKATNDSFFPQLEYKEVFEGMREWVDRNGYDKFQRLLDIQKERRKAYRKKGYEKQKLEDWEDELEDIFGGDDPPPPFWMYYH